MMAQGVFHLKFTAVKSALSWLNHLNAVFDSDRVLTLTHSWLDSQSKCRIHTVSIHIRFVLFDQKMAKIQNF